jgi:hypothetical protein
MGIFGVVCGHVTDHMSSAFCVVETDAIATDDAIATTTGAVTAKCKVTVPPAPLPSLLFANDWEGRGDEEWGSVVVGHHGALHAYRGRRADGGRVVPTAVEPRGKQCGGVRGAGGGTTDVSEGKVASSSPSREEEKGGRSHSRRRAKKTRWGEEMGAGGQ